MLVTKGDSRNSAVVESRSTARRRQSLFFRRFFLFVLAGLVAIFSVLPRLTPPPPPDWSSLLPPSTDRDEPLQALVLTAHPDDECMFFSPTILSLVEQQAHVRALCLSSGNATGIGSRRSEELLSSYTMLGLNQSDVAIVNNIDLPDTMKTAWDPAIIASVLTRYLDEHPVDVIITFDTGGVTQHPNHTPLSLGVKLLSAQSARRSSPHTSDLPTHMPRLLILETVPKRVKFTGVLFPFCKTMEYRLHRWMAFFRSDTRPTRPVKLPIVWDITSSHGGYVIALRAMMQHKSQLVWFRWLYVTFSKYMWSNRLVEVQM